MAVALSVVHFVVWLAFLCVAGLLSVCLIGCFDKYLSLFDYMFFLLKRLK